MLKLYKLTEPFFHGKYCLPKSRHTGKIQGSVNSLTFFLKILYMNTVYTRLCSPPTPPIPVCVSLFRFLASNSLCSSSLPFPPLPSHTHKNSLLESFSPAHMFSELISWDHLTYQGVHTRRRLMPPLPEMISCMLF